VAGGALNLARGAGNQPQVAERIDRVQPAICAIERGAFRAELGCPRAITPGKGNHAEVEQGVGNPDWPVQGAEPEHVPLENGRRVVVPTFADQKAAPEPLCH
jgi:hypothetical protein